MDGKRNMFGRTFGDEREACSIYQQKKNVLASSNSKLKKTLSAIYRRIGGEKIGHLMCSQMKEGDCGQGRSIKAKGESLDVISADPEMTRDGVPRNALQLAHTAPPQRLQGLRLTD